MALGVLAGFIHSALVLQTGGPVAGLNLYNNGFSGGLIAIVLYPTITAIARHRRPKLRDEDYYDLFEENQPIDTSRWRTHARDQEARRTPVAVDSHASAVPEEQDLEDLERDQESACPKMPEDNS